MIMVEWFNKLSNAEKIAVAAIVVPVAFAVVCGLFKLIKWLLGKENSPATQQKTIHQKGSRNKAAVIDGSGNTANIAEGDIHTGIDSETALTILVETSAKLGRSQEENKQLR